MNFKTTISIFSLPLLLMAASCSETTEERIEERTDNAFNSVEAGMDRLEARVRRSTGNPDKDFAADAIEANSQELKALRLGEQRGGPKVKQAVASMMPDHQQLGEQMKSYVTAKNMTFNDLDTARIDDDYEFNDTGADFDRKWAEEMVEDHEDVVELFEDAQDDVKDAELKTMITNTLPKLRQHLEMSRKLRDELSNTRNDGNTTSPPSNP